MGLKTILVGSDNPVKTNAVKEAFGFYYDPITVIGLQVPSGVSAQPINEETFIGARNRTLGLKTEARSQNIQADFFVSIEGGIIQIFERWFIFGAICIHDDMGHESLGSSAHFEVPPGLINPMLKGEELGALTDDLAGEEDTKSKGGTVGFCTNGKVDRTRFYVDGLKVAIIPFLNPKLYPKMARSLYSLCSDDE